MTESSNQSENQTGGIWRQVRSLLPTITVASLIALGGVILTVFIARETNNPIWKLAKDPAQVMDYEPYIGMLSNWGVLIWMSSAVICWFTERVMKKNGAPVKTRLFLLAAAVLSFTLAVDDLYLLHDEIIPGMFGVRERYLYYAYLLTLILFILYFAREIHRQDYLLFWASFMFLFVSRGIFILLPFMREYETPGDMLKHFGIVFWFAFYYRVALREVSSLIDSKRSH